MSLENLNESLGEAKLGFGSGAKSGLAYSSAIGMFEQVNKLVETLNRLRGDAALLPVDDSASAARRIAVYTGVSHRSYERAVAALQAASGETPSNEHLATASQYGAVCINLTSFTPEGASPTDNGVPMRAIAEGLDDIQKGLDIAVQAAGRVSIGLVHALRSLEAAPNIANMATEEITAYQNQAGLPTEHFPTTFYIKQISNELPPF